jgi:NADH dehydrogenase
MKHIVVIGGGFAGLWSAMGAARKLDELHVAPDDVAITLVSRDRYHSIRVRNYERDLSNARVPLDQVLAPIGVRRVEGNVTGIDFARQQLHVETADGNMTLLYDRLVCAAGSRLYRSDIPGLDQYGFTVDTYDEAVKLGNHLKGLHRYPDTPGRYTAVVIGAGLTGVEIACEMPDRLRTAAALDGHAASHTGNVRVILVDSLPNVGSAMGDSARPVIEEALSALSVERRLATTVQSVDDQGVMLSTGERIDALTVICTMGLRASPLADLFAVERDRWGRLPVDEFLKVRGIDNVFAAGDIAAAMVDNEHTSVMSCQHSIPTGIFAGHNVVCELLGKKPLPLYIDWYVTILDLGPWGAVYTNGWERKVVASGAEVTQIKRHINSVRIYPPLSGNRREILDAAAPVIQPAPAQ